MYINWKDITDNSLVDTTLHALKIAVQAGTAVIGKVRLVTADGDEITNDTLDSVKISQATHDNLNLNANLQVADADVSTTNPASVQTVHGIACWAVFQNSSANSVQTLAKAAEASKKHYVLGFEVVISGAAAGADTVVELRDGATVKWRTFIGSGAPRGERVGVMFSQPVELSTNTAANLYVAAGGASVVTTASMLGYTR